MVQTNGQDLFLLLLKMDDLQIVLCVCVCVCMDIVRYIYKNCQ